MTESENGRKFHKLMILNDRGIDGKGFYRTDVTKTGGRFIYVACMDGCRTRGFISANNLGGKNVAQWVLANRCAKDKYIEPTRHMLKMLGKPTEAFKADPVGTVVLQTVLACYRADYHPEINRFFFQLDEKVLQQEMRETPSGTKVQVRNAGGDLFTEAIFLAYADDYKVNGDSMPFYAYVEGKPAQHYAECRLV